MKVVAFAVGLVACCLAFQVNGAPIKKDSLQKIFSNEALEAFAKAQQDLSTADFIYAFFDKFGHLALCASWVLASAPEPEKAKMAKNIWDIWKQQSSRKCLFMSSMVLMRMAISARLVATVAHLKHREHKNEYATGFEPTELSYN